MINMLFYLRKTAMLNDRLEMLVKEIKRADRATLEKINEYIAYV